MGFCLWILFLVITVGYAETMILFLLGAREASSNDEKIFFEAASQEAYKLAVKIPRLYFYNGSLERAFILQNQGNVSIVLDKEILKTAQLPELKAICFELLLQVKKGMASKRTKSMFLLGTIAWMLHSFVSLITKFIPVKNVRSATDWLLTFLMQPVIELLFKLLIGESYFKKLETYMGEFPKEKELLEQVGLKLRKPYSYHSLPSRKLLELSSANKSKQFQNMMVLEFLPHEWDYFFRKGEMIRAEEI